MKQSRKPTTLVTVFRQVFGQIKEARTSRLCRSFALASCGRTRITNLTRRHHSVVTRRAALGAKAASTVCSRTWSDDGDACGRAQDTQAVHRRRIRALG